MTRQSLSGLLVARPCLKHGVLSGVTEIFDPEGQSLGAVTLTNPLDVIFFDDRRVLHGVTPIAATDPACTAFRAFWCSPFAATRRRYDRRFSLSRVVGMHAIDLARALHVLSVVIWIGGRGIGYQRNFAGDSTWRAGRRGLQASHAIEHCFIRQAITAVLVVGATGFYIGCEA